MSLDKHQPRRILLPGQKRTVLYMWDGDVSMKELKVLKVKELKELYSFNGNRPRHGEKPNPFSTNKEAIGNPIASLLN